MREDAEDAGMGPLDLLVAVVENLRILVLGVTCAGLLGYGLSFFWPEQFVSQAILALPEATPGVAQNGAHRVQAFPLVAQAAVMMVSQPVLDPVVQSLPPVVGQSAQRARMVLAEQIKVTVGKEGLMRLEVTARAPAEAQAIANAVIDSWLRTTVPTEQYRLEMALRLEHDQRALLVIDKTLRQLSLESPAGASIPGGRLAESGNVVALLQLQSQYLDRTLNLPRLMAGVTRDVVKQAPTLPTDAESPRRARVAGVSALVTGLALLVWVCARRGWRNVAPGSGFADNQDRLRAAFRRGGRGV